MKCNNETHHGGMCIFMIYIEQYPNITFQSRIAEDNKLQESILVRLRENNFITHKQ